MSTTTAARTALSNHVASGDTATLATCLLRLEEGLAAGILSRQTHRTASTAIVDELAKRHPEVVSALEAWEMDLDTDMSLNEAVLAALPLEALR